jgi:hypothetical protein
LLLCSHISLAQILDPGVMHGSIHLYHWICLNLIVHLFSLTHYLYWIIGQAADVGSILFSWYEISGTRILFAKLLPFRSTDIPLAMRLYHSNLLLHSYYLLVLLML